MDTTNPREVDYWPLLRSAMAAAAVSLVVHVVAVVWFGLQHGAEIRLGILWIFPYFRVLTNNVATFNSIIAGATVTTAVAVTVFAVLPFVRRRRLQIQMGRAFGFLDLMLLGLLHLRGERLGAVGVAPTRLMIYIAAFGALGFGLVLFLVVDAYRARSSRDAGPGRLVEPSMVAP